MKKSKKLKNLFLLTFGVILLIGLVGFIALFITINNLPSVELLQSRHINESTKIFDRTGEVLLFELYGEERRTVIPFDQIPEIVKQSTLVIEDVNFYNHGAVDIKGILRAALINAKTGSISQGGSTITQQFAKTAFLTLDRTFVRKFKEAILSYQLEKTFSKDEILGLYLNQIPYGSNAYGIEAATNIFFQKDLGDLSLAEVATLVSLPQAPSYYSPWGSHLDDLMARKNQVLENLEAGGYITNEEKIRAKNEEIKFSRPANLSLAPHFVIQVKEYLDAKYGEEFVRRSGLKVITTLDAKIQEYAEDAVAKGVERNSKLYGGTNGALVTQDATTGQVLALVGSRNYFDEEIDGNFNVAIQGLRQPGSALKPFIYLSAFEKGYSDETIVFDVETEFNTTNNPRDSYSPENFDGFFRGPVNLRTALAQSMNVPAVKTLYLTGINTVLDNLHRFGITTLKDRSRFGLSLVLGGGEVTLSELVNAYSTLAQEGIYQDQSIILLIEDSNGRVLEEYTQKTQRVMDPQYPRMVNNILTDIEARSGLFVSSLPLTLFPGYEVAIKTGTTNDYRDAWAVGYTPTFVTGVWTGNNDNTPMHQQGSSLLAAIPILHNFLSKAIVTTEATSFNPPDKVITTKPMVNGSIVAQYTSGGNSYPHVHNILHYIDKNNPAGETPTFPQKDSQYENWETPVINWARNNIDNFFIYNQTLPSNAKLLENKNENGIFFLEPTAGSFINNSFKLSANIQSVVQVSSIDVYFNDVLIDKKIFFNESVVVYENTLTPQVFKEQNKLVLTVTDTAGNTFSEDLILYH